MIHPVGVTLTFEQAGLPEFTKFCRYMRTQCSNVKTSAYFNQVAPEVIDCTILIDKPDTGILNFKGLKCSKEKISYFFKKQPKQQVLSFFLNITTGHNAFLLLIDEEAYAETVHAIQIHSWEGKPVWHFFN